MLRSIPRSDAEMHYNKLTKYFKWLVSVSFTAIVSLAAIATWITYDNVREVKADSKAAMDRASAAAQISIDSIRSDAARLALAEARARVAEAFKANNVVEMVENAAKKQTGAVIERQVSYEVDQYMSGLHSEITSLGVLADNAMKMRIGIRDGLEQLRATQSEGKSPDQRKRAADLLRSITADYDSMLARDKHIVNTDYAKFLEASLEIPDTLQKEKLQARLVRIIQRDPNLNKVALAFYILRRSSGVRFRMFDVDAVSRWCASNPDECRE